MSNEEWPLYIVGHGAEAAQAAAGPVVPIQVQTAYLWLAPDLLFCCGWIHRLAKARLAWRGGSDH